MASRKTLPLLDAQTGVVGQHAGIDSVGSHIGRVITPGSVTEFPIHSASRVTKRDRGR